MAYESITLTNELRLFLVKYRVHREFMREVKKYWNKDSIIELKTLLQSFEWASTRKGFKYWKELDIMFNIYITQ